MSLRPEKRSRVTVNDTVSDFLQSKITAGSGVSFSVLNPAANEQLQISSTVGGSFGYTTFWIPATIELWAGVSGSLPTQLVRTYGGATGTCLRLLGMDQADIVCAAILTPIAYNGSPLLCRLATTVNVGTTHGNRTFQIGAQSYADSEAILSTVGTETAVVVPETTNDVMYLSSEFSVTPGGTPAGGELMQLRIRRDADGVANQIDLVGLLVRWPVS